MKLVKKKCNGFILLDWVWFLVFCVLLWDLNFFEKVCFFVKIVFDEIIIEFDILSEGLYKDGILIGNDWEVIWYCGYGIFKEIK